MIYNPSIFLRRYEHLNWARITVKPQYKHLTGKYTTNIVLHLEVVGSM